MPTRQYVYRGRVETFYDGDTFHLGLDCGFGITRSGRCRLAGVNAPEIATDAGKVAAVYTKAWFDAITAVPPSVKFDRAWPLIVESRALDPYGRPIVAVWRLSDGHSLGDDLLASGNAVVYPPAPAP